MVRMDHLVLHSDIIPSKDKDGISPRMMKRIQVVDSTVDDNLSAFDRFQWSHCGHGGVVTIVIVAVVGIGEAIAETGSISVWSHDTNSTVIR